MNTSFTDVEVKEIALKDAISMPKGQDEYRIAVISDVHLAHKRVRTEKIVNVLEKIFPEERMALLDAIICTGDLFDSRISYDSPDAILATLWIEKILRLCERYGVAFIILEGTPSHDNRQPKWVTTIASICKIKADVRYYDGIKIDDLYPNGPKALFIQDEANHDASDTWMQVMARMREQNLESVDFAFMHGMFTFQEPIRTVVSHNEENYHSVVKHRIVIGHHHTHAVCGRIVVPGSLERLRHNEEEKKGHYQFSIFPDGVRNDYFIPNEEATVFETLSVENLSYSEVISLIDSKLHYPPGSNIRLQLSRKDAAFVSLREIRDKYPQFNIGTKVVETAEYVTDGPELIEKPVIVAIRQDTIADLLKSRLADIPEPVMKEVDAILSTC